MLYLVTSPSGSPVTAEVSSMNIWNTSTENTERGTIWKQSSHDFLCAIPFKNLSKFQAHPGIPTGCPNPCESWRMWPYIISTMCLLLITAADTVTCSSWLKKKHMLWRHTGRHKENDLIKCTLAHKSSQQCSAICSWKNTVQDQARFCGQVSHRRETAAREQKMTWAWGYRWTLLDTLSSLGRDFTLFKDRKPAGGSLVPTYLRCNSWARRDTAMNTRWAH